MAPIYKEIFERYHERKRMLNPCFQFGSGIMVPSEFTKYFKDILFLSLLEMFYRELRDNPNRADADLRDIVSQIMERVGLSADAVFVERLASALLSSGSGYNREPFVSTYYDETSNTFEEERFVYLTEDTEAMLREKTEAQIWKLSESGQRLIFLSLEMADEYAIEIQQLYTLSFIRKGNFQKALSNMDHVKAAVRNRASQERDYAKRMRRDPRWILGNSREQNERRKDLREQFKEQKRLFSEMDDIIYKKLKDAKDPKTIREIESLKEKVDECVEEHITFTELVVQNYGQEMALQKEIERLLNYNRSFAKDIWETYIYSSGFILEEGFGPFLEPLFSPKPEFIYPLSWAWEEHEISDVEAEEELAEETQALPLPCAKRPPIDWKSVVSLWKIVFETALADPQKIYSLRNSNLGEWTLDALELWMKFREGDFALTAPLSLQKKYEDERIVLFQQMIKEFPAMIEVTRYKVQVRSDGGAPIQNRLVTIAPFTLTLIPNNGG